MAADREALPKFPLQWVACWLLLPNFLVVLMWPITGVPMQAGLLLSGLAALVVSQIPSRPARALGVVAIILMVAALYVCRLFSIPPLNYELVGQFLADVRPLQSPEYILAAVAVLAIMGAGVVFAPKVKPLRGRIQFLYALVAVGAFVNLDGALALESRRVHASLPSDATPIDSAVRQVALAPASHPGRHVLVIVVEAFGAPAMPEEQALLAADWDRPEWRRRYEVRRGTTEYFGSTTNGELRELCARWAHYTDFDAARADCLPKRFRAAGYGTTAIHSFGGELFGRRGWYPAIGFDRMIFAPELLDAGARSCPGVFPGVCDADVPSIIGKRLAEARTPQFVYWLTLNTHLPVVAHEALGTTRCTIGPARWRADFPGLCRLFQVHHILADRISEMAMAPDFPPTDILIVGDHKPPLFDRVSNARFDPGRVPWIYLKARHGSADRQDPPAGPSQARR